METVAASHQRSHQPGERASNLRYTEYPRLRFMGSKHRLLPWIERVVRDLEFETALDAFSGSGCVSYLLKTAGKSVRSNDFLRFASDFARATVANSCETLTDSDVELLLSPAEVGHPRFVETTFRGIFFTDADNAFLDQVWAHLPELSPYKRSLALSALYRACLKRQPRAVFTVSGLGAWGGKGDWRDPFEAIGGDGA